MSSNDSSNNVYCDRRDSNSTNQLNIVTIEGCPDLLSLHSHNSDRYPFLLQSTSSEYSEKNKNSRYDILFAFPQQKLVLKSNSILYLDNKLCTSNDFLTTLDKLWSKEASKKITESNKVKLPFSGGWFLYLSYELLGQIEEKVQTHPLPSNMDIAVAVRIPAAIICDHEENKTYLMSEMQCESYIAELKKDINRDDLTINLNVKTSSSNTVTEENPECFIDNISIAKKYIHEGDIFQANLSREWFITDAKKINAVSIYKKLRNSNPASFSGIVKLNDLTIISSSPERLIKVKDGYIETRPIAGTTNRAKNKTDDAELAKILLNHPKEKAEHVMLIDMERNDIGKVCQAGSVEVNEMMVIETLAHVHHIVSNIKGKLIDTVTPGDIIKSVFPGGSITGCPKVRCMEIIYKLENKARNSYTGSMGYLNNNGDIDLNILIRTIEKTMTNTRFRTGAGIVNDSIAEDELQETRNKAKGLLSALL